MDDWPRENMISLVPGLHSEAFPPVSTLQGTVPVRTAVGSPEWALLASTPCLVGS